MWFNRSITLVLSPHLHSPQTHTVDFWILEHQNFTYILLGYLKLNLPFYGNIPFVALWVNIRNSKYLLNSQVLPIQPINMKSVGQKLMKLEQHETLQFLCSLTVWFYKQFMHKMAYSWKNECFFSKFSSWGETSIITPPTSFAKFTGTLRHVFHYFTAYLNPISTL